MKALAIALVVSCTIPSFICSQDEQIQKQRQNFLRDDEAHSQQAERIGYLDTSDQIESRTADTSDQEQSAQSDELDLTERDVLQNEEESADDAQNQAYAQLPDQQRTIREIRVVGNVLVPASAILDRIAYKKGELFDSTKSRTAIHNLYYGLKRFRTIDIFTENVGSDGVIVYIEVEEKKPLKDLVVVGNKQVSNKEINTALNTSELAMIDPEELDVFAATIKKTYADKGYHLTKITPELLIDETNRATATLKIEENKKAIVKRIEFIGNNNITSKKLRNALLTHEDWLFGMLDKSGTFLADRLEGDKYMIEQLYQNSGYMNAKVVDVDVAMDPYTKALTLTFEIKEGDLYTIKDIKVSGNDILSDDYLVSILPLRPCMPYSRAALVDSIKTLEMIWGDFGYLYTHIEPSIQPDEDDKTVNISFYCDIGNPIFLNTITIKGNNKTRDKIIRRKISLQEGLLITNSNMEASKNRIEALGYFDQREGVNWKTIRISEDTADLELVVKEVKTGNAHLKIGFGGAQQTDRSAEDPDKPDSLEDKNKAADRRNSILNGVTAEVNVADTNLFGSGIRTALTLMLSANQKTGTFNITQPWLFDKPIYGAMDVYYKRTSYDQLSMTPVVNERQAGGLLTTGLVINTQYKGLQETFVRASLGADSISYGKDNIGGTDRNRVLMANMPSLLFDDFQQTRRQLATTTYNELLAKLFDPGMFLTLTGNIGRDQRNHPMHPSRGLSWLARSILGLPFYNSSIGFYKADIDLNWFTPLIGEHDLVLRLHGYFGFIQRLKHRNVPYRELFHIGGPSSVRGFLWGQIGPQFQVIETNRGVRQDSIGASRTTFVNAELIFPVTRDFNLKGVLFYDGGAGWKNPYVDCIKHLDEFVVNQHFHYRHAVGFGIRLLNPMPIRVDWGFKLDARKNESPYEVHFGMTYDW